MPSSVSTASSPALPGLPCCRPPPVPSSAPFSRPISRPVPRLLTDGFAGYRGRDAAIGERLKHTPVVQGEGANASEFFPVIHTLFSNIKA